MKKYLALGLAALLAIGATIVPDAYDKLFLRMDGTTTTFVDSSTENPKTITANGDATQLPIKFNKSAGFFNGTTDYLDIANSTDFAFGTGAFTIEGFFNTGIDATAQTILDTRAATANTTGLLVNIINSTGNKLCVTTATTARITGTTTLAKNTWYHFMVVGNGGANGARTIVLYLDGVQEGSTYTNDYNFTDQTLRIGAIKAAAGTYMNGWMKELRISNVARTVAVPTAQYKSDANTVLLMHFDTPATSPLAPAIYFDGTGDYLEVANSNDYKVGTGDYTLEGWFNPEVITGQPTFISMGTHADGVAMTIYNSNTLYCYEANTARQFAWVPTANKWHHVALSRDSGTLRAFVDGKQVGSDIASSSNIQTTSVFRVGYDSGSVLNQLKGFAREVRFSNVARYTTAFTPSQTGFTVDANTKLYIKGDEDNGVTTFVDSSTSPKTVTTAGDTKIKYTEDYRSCIFKDETGKFPYPVGSAKVDFFAIGAGAFYGDGSTGYLTVANHADLKMGTGDFSIEGYGRLSVSQNNNYMFDMIVWPSGGWGMWVAATTNILGTVNGATNSNGASTTGVVQLNTWFHAAQVRSSGVTKVYLNGTQVYSVADTADFQQSRDLDIGDFFYTYNSTHYESWAGLLDNIRISKGVARYTATFNPPDDYSAPRVGKRKTNWFFFF